MINKIVYEKFCAAYPLAKSYIRHCYIIEIMKQH
jgi:hypothetical protein